MRKREGWKETAGLDRTELAWGGPQKAEEKREGDELTGRCQAWMTGANWRMCTEVEKQVSGGK